ncbi:MAG: STAS domain-containing protein [Phycisphaeraceae bacterium]|nr:STAS domain-containing protein [Phycisphaeraceae bacterium]
MIERKPMIFEISVDGRLDTETYKQMNAYFESLFENTVKGIQISMEKLEYISSMGLRSLLEVQKKAKAMGCPLVVTNPQLQVKAVLDIAKILPPQQIFASIEEADRYFDAIQQDVLDKNSP